MDLCSAASAPFWVTCFKWLNDHVNAQILESVMATNHGGLGKFLNMMDSLEVVPSQDHLDMLQGHRLQNFRLMINTISIGVVSHITHLVLIRWNLLFLLVWYYLRICTGNILHTWVWIWWFICMFVYCFISIASKEIKDTNFQNVSDNSFLSVHF